MSEYEPSMASVMAAAVNEAYKKYLNPEYQITLGNYTVKDLIYVFESAEAGYVFFGFSATGQLADGAPINNIVALRGTQSDEEAFDDMEWGPVPCVLPAGSGQQYGQAAQGVYDFYTGNDEGLVTSLADSFKAAVSNLDGSYDWYVGAHSLGGAVATLAALDAVVSGSYNNSQATPRLYTFGSLHVGDAEFASLFPSSVPDAYRVANLADWVPAFTGAEADAPGYVHVGLECTFLWQTWADWGNHSLVNIYLETVRNHPGVIQFGPRQYPQ